MNTIRVTKVGDKLACVIRGPSKRTLLQGFVYTAEDCDRVRPAIRHWLSERRTNEVIAEMKALLS